jgi:hypothetical protein
MTIFQKYKQNIKNGQQFKPIIFDNNIEVGIMIKENLYYSAYFANNSILHIQTNTMDDAINLFWIIVNKYDTYKHNLINYIKEINCYE